MLKKLLETLKFLFYYQKDQPNFNVNKFVFASDFSDEIKKPFAKVVEFANKFDAELHVVMINTPSSFKPTHLSEEIMDKFVGGFNANKLLNIFITM
jgi:uncharacterized protein with von Willebrand factor type A (vWA) domain